MSHFGFPIIPDDLRCEETILQASRNLALLNRLFESTVQSVTDAIAANGNKINEISNRLALIDYKISQIKGSKKAIQIFSGSKYPSKKASPLVESSRPKQDLKEKLNSLSSTNEPLGINKNASHPGPDETALRTRQQFHRVSNIFDQTVNLDVTVQGLGNLLADSVTSVSSLLLFNTAQHL
jgi:hypothetical protein